VVGEVRIDSGWGEKTTFMIVDAQSVKSTDTATAVPQYRSTEGL